MNSHFAFLAFAVAGLSAACTSTPMAGTRRPDANPDSVWSAVDATTPGSSEPDARPDSTSAVADVVPHDTQARTDSAAISCEDKRQLYYAAVTAAQQCDPSAQAPCAEYSGVECPSVGVNPDAVASLSAELAEFRAAGCELPLHSCPIVVITPPPYVCRPGTDGVARCFCPCEQMVGGRASCVSKTADCPNFVIPDGYCGGTSVCCVAVCGDGLLAAGEECDDGNSRNGDGCSSSCKCENSSCGKRIGVCGDGVTDYGKGEECDDGNTLNEDGCSSTCQVEPCWANCTCNGTVPCTSVMFCGNGKLEGSEACDDGNALPGDGCSGTCQIEPNWYCASPGRPCQVVPGDPSPRVLMIVAEARNRKTKDR